MFRQNVFQLKEKIYYGNENFNKTLFLLKYLIDLDKISKSSNYINKRTFLAKIYFSSKFFVWNKGENFNETIFSNISIQVEKNLVMPSGREYLLTSRKIFNCVFKKIFKKVINKNLENFH